MAKLLKQPPRPELPEAHAHNEGLSALSPQGRMKRLVITIPVLVMLIGCVHPAKVATVTPDTAIVAFGANRAVPEIHVAHGKYGDYYHVRFTLTPDNCELTVSLSERRPRYSDSNEYTFAEGGQFEVFVRKQDFPVPSPHTSRTFLILRMPWTDPSAQHAEKHISAKRVLFDKIKRMKTEGKGTVEVVVELNPYVTVLNRDPLTVELSGRNIFFRQAHSQYIDYVGPLKSRAESQ